VFVIELSNMNWEQRGRGRGESGNSKYEWYLCTRLNRNARDIRGGLSDGSDPPERRGFFGVFVLLQITNVEIGADHHWQLKWHWHRAELALALRNISAEWHFDAQCHFAAPAELLNHPHNLLVLRNVIQTRLVCLICLVEHLAVRAEITWSDPWLRNNSCTHLSVDRGTWHLTVTLLPKLTLGISARICKYVSM